MRPKREETGSGRLISDRSQDTILVVRDSGMLERIENQMTSTKRSLFSSVCGMSQKDL